MCVRMYACVFVCACMCACVCVCVRVCVFVCMCGVYYIENLELQARHGYIEGSTLNFEVFIP